MAARRQGDPSGAPHEILDPRDLKYCSNQCMAFWYPDDDPFLWSAAGRAVGLAELQIGGWPLLVLLALGVAIAVALGGGRTAGGWRGGFRSSQSAATVPRANAIVAPADGKVVDVTELEHYDFFDGPAIRIGIFLSIFNVHVNRAPRAGRVAAMHYKPGEFLDALNPESAIRNEFMWIGFQDAERPGLKLPCGRSLGFGPAECVRYDLGGRESGAMFGMIAWLADELITACGFAWRPGRQIVRAGALSRVFDMRPIGANV
jgi:phosphatidylserine decarboxylase